MADMTVGALLRERGVSRRTFLKFCTALASLMALPPGMGGAIARAVERARRPSVIWLSFQECTGCTESLTRSATPTVEGLILDVISLDYHHTLQAASGTAAEAAREQAMKEAFGHYVLIVDGSIPLGNAGYSTIAGISNAALLAEAAKGAAAVVAVGSCASFGGLPAAEPNPTGAVAVSQLVTDRPVVNVPGCPPIGVVIAGVVAHYLTFGKVPELDGLGRPKVFYGETIHDRCYRRTFYDRGMFAESFDDEGARKGWCLYKLGCKGPVTYNACATTKWNAGTSFPIQSGHGCLGCSEPAFWDVGGFYNALSVTTIPLNKPTGIALAAGAAVGAAVAIGNRKKQADARKGHQTATLGDLEKQS